jgi:group I intron endonuclease
MNIYTHSVYWIHLPHHTDSTNEGYVGVTNNIKRRFSEHLNDSKKRNDKNPFFGRVLQKHKDEIIQTIIFQGTEEGCYLLEELLRPIKNIGWNANKGGNKPPSQLGRIQTTATREKRVRTLKGRVMSSSWKEKLALAKKGEKNGMFGKKIVCSEKRKISIIKSKNKHRLPELMKAFSLLSKGYSIKKISEMSGCGQKLVAAIKKDPSLHFEAFPILKQFKTS